MSYALQAFRGINYITILQAKMSDEFSECSLSFKRQIVVNQPEIRYAAKAHVNEIIFPVNIPFPLLKEWHKIVASSLAEGTSSQNFLPEVKPAQLKMHTKSITWICWNIVFPVAFLLLQMMNR